MLTTPPAMLVDIDTLKIMLDDYDADELKSMFVLLYDRAVNGVVPEDLPRDMKPLYKLFWNCIEIGFISSWESQICGSYGGKGGKNGTGLELWQWWARHEDYTEILFRNSSKYPWYDSAKEEHARLIKESGVKTPKGGLTIKDNEIQSNQTKEKGNITEGNRDSGEREEDIEPLSDDDIKARLTEIIIQESGERKRGLQYAEQYFDTKNSVWGKTWEHYLETQLEPQMGLVNHARYYAKQRKQIDEQV